MGEVGLGQLWRARDTEAGIDVVLTEEGDETALAVRDSILSERGKGQRAIGGGIGRTAFSPRWRPCRCFEEGMFATSSTMVCSR